MVEYEIYSGCLYAVIKRKKGAELTDACPFCARNHKHGKTQGHKNAQCKQHFIVEAPDGTSLDNKNGYMLKEYA